METQIEKLSQWIADFTIKQVPEPTLEKARLQVLDCVASICAGSRSVAGKKIYQALLKLSPGQGEHRILHSGESWSLENAVYLHAALINALELDNFCYMGHLSQSAFSVALAVSEKTKATNNDFLESLICAEEISGRMSAYMASGRLQGHMRSFIHRVGAAVATVKLYKCSRQVIANAIAISLSSPELPMYPSSFSPDTKITSVCSATVEGMRSAFLAMEGFDATRDIIEHPAGFVKIFSHLKQVPDFWHSLGKTWVMDSISFKYYPSCAHSQGAVNAVLIAIGSNNILSKDIREIHLHCPVVTLVMEEFSVPHHGSGLTQVNINFSTKKSVCAAILSGGFDGSFFAEGAIEKYYEQIVDLSDKVFIHHSWKLTIDLIMGLDACMENPGYPGVLDFGNSDNTLKYLKKVYRNRTLFELSELSGLFRLPKGYLKYLIKRALKSYTGKIGLSKLRSAETDLSKLQFKIGTIAEIHTNSGEVLTGICEVPKGFAGDPDQKLRAIEKFQRECKPVLGDEYTARLLNYILAEGFPVIRGEMACIRYL